MNRLVAVGVAALVALTGSVAGCSSSSPDQVAPSPTTSGPAYPVVLPKQAQRIDDAVEVALETATTRLDVAQAGDRVRGPAREVLGARIAITKAKGPAQPTPAPLTPSRILAPVADGWPRWYLAAGTVPGEQAPVVQVYLSPSAREPYGLWGRLSLVPGATLPEAAATQSGVPALDPAADAASLGLVLSPNDVALRYADVLNRGTSSDYAKAFAPDTFRDQVDKRLVADRVTIIQTGIGNLVDAHTPQPSSTFAVRTSDGGALVVTALRQTYVVTVSPGKGTVTVEPVLAALAGKSSFTTSLTRTAVEVLAFAVPPAGSTSPVRLVAAAKDDVSATGS